MFAPVFLETMDLERRKIRVARMGDKGLYRFEGLPPGRYRIVSSYDFDPPDKYFMEAAKAPEISLMESSAAVQDLALFAP